MDRRIFRVLLYASMACMDCVSGIIIFIGPVRATILGYDPLIAGSMVTARSICGCLASYAVSRFLTSSNSIRLLFLSNIMYFVSALLGLWATNLAMLYVTSAMAGVFMAVFSAAFQVFMKDVDSSPVRPLSRVIGAYTFAWCGGMAFGPFITGFLMELGKPKGGVGLSVGWFYTYLVAAGLTLFTFFTLLWVRKVTADHMRRHLAGEGETIDVSESRGRPDLAWMGWVMACVGSIVLGTLRAVFPAGVTQAGMPEWRSGMVMTLVALATGCFALLVSFNSRLLYSGRRMFAVGVLGLAGYVMFFLPWLLGWSLLEHVGQYYAGGIMVGCFSGIMYLYSGFHSLAHPERAGRNISLNEFFLAIGMVTGTLGGGWLAKHYGFYPPFVLSAVLVLLLAAFQLYAHRKYGGEEPRPVN